jgi:hypothetical protein
MFADNRVARARNRSAAERIDFDGRYEPESDEILQIQDFADSDEMFGAAENPLQRPVQIINDAALENLIGLFVVTTVERRKSVCLQVFDRRRALTRGKFALINTIGDHLQKLEQTGLILDTAVTAVLHGSDLLFKSFHNVSRLFDLSAQYHEATDQELLAFADHDGIAPPESRGSFLTLTDTTRIRKQIALILDSKILERVPATTIVQRAADFNLTVSTSRVDGKKKIVLPDTRPELKIFLDFLQENFYKGCLTSTTFLTNSKRAVR